MGGFAIDISGFPDFLPPDTGKLWTLTEEGVVAAAKLQSELLLSLLEPQIADKSKADALAKMVVCIQAFWFCVQCLSRFAQSMPISLLEVCPLLALLAITFAALIPSAQYFRALYLCCDNIRVMVAQAFRRQRACTHTGRRGQAVARIPLDANEPSWKKEPSRGKVQTIRKSRGFLR